MATGYYIDCYGWNSNDSNFQHTEKKPYEIVKSGSYTYIRFSAADTGAIWRIDESVDNTTKICWAWGSWTGKASLSYTLTLSNAYWKAV